MNYYVFVSYAVGGKLYIGSRACKCAPEEDTQYMGQPNDPTFKPDEKVILKTFETRSEAIKHECFLHSRFRVGESEYFANDYTRKPRIPDPIFDYSQYAYKPAKMKITVGAF